MPSKKEKFIYKIIMIVCAIVAFATAIYLAVSMFSNQNNYFTLHFALPLALACVSVIAFLMPIATRTKYQGDQAKDNLMMVVAVLLMLMAIVTIVLSYLNLNFGA